jgi:hypothetical protein
MPETLALSVTKPWRASYDPALAVRAGDTVTPGRKSNEYTGWQWVKNRSGLGGWIPADILTGTRITQDFDTRELTVETGYTVTSLATRVGWHWCRDRHGREGWLPTIHIENP